MTTKNLETVDVADAEVLRVNAVSVDCPYCEASQDGWIADPRGKVHECGDCGKSYRVPDDVQIAF
jgi:hypothetical protein